MRVEVFLTEEQRAAIPDFENRLKRFQRRVDGWTKRDKFRLILHEGSHVWAYRKFGVPITGFHGPDVRWRCGEPVFAGGSVTRGDVSTLPKWMHGAASSAGYLAVEVLTGAPEDTATIENDNRFHEKSDLGIGEIFIRSELADSLHEILSAAREYEMNVFGTDEMVLWGINEFRIFHPGERYHVGISHTGWAGVLVEHDGRLRLYVDGIEYTPADKIDGYHPTLVVPYGPKRNGVEEVVKLWNNVVAATYITHPRLGSGAALQPL